MKLNFRISLKIARKIYLAANPDSSVFGRNWQMFSDKGYANELIYQKLVSDNPCMIARIGATEMLNLMNYLGVKNKLKYKNYKTYIQGKTPPWWWEKSTIKQLETWSGFYPATTENVERFCELMFKDIPYIDVLGSWLKQENFFQKELRNSKRVVLEDLEPFFSPKPWTKALEGKKVLVVHPFVETIEKQYHKRELIFGNNLLPAFELKTIKAVQSIAGAETEYVNWFEALESMKEKISNTDYDICILGAGAYGLPLAAHVKRSGKKSIHLGGVTQLLFGIIGKRWEDFLFWPYMNLFNEHWLRPDATERPAGAEKVEDACYW